MLQNKNTEDKDISIPAYNKDSANQEAMRGKKAIDAGKIAAGEGAAAKEVKQKEKKDADNWRNEG